MNLRRPIVTNGEFATELFANLFGQDLRFIHLVVFYRDGILEVDGRVRRATCRAAVTPPVECMTWMKRIHD